VFDLEKTIAMVNFDMIGWLREGKLTAFGSGCGSSFDELLDAAAKDTEIVLNKVASPFAGSDHMPFYQKNIPVLFLHTGLTDTYHTPEDDFETLNMSGAVDVIDFSEKLIWSLVNREDKPEFVAAEGGRRTRPSYFGVRFDYNDTKNGLRVISVAADSPAQKAGLQDGDVVLELAGAKVTERSELATILRENKPGSKIAVKFTRDGEEQTIEVELGEPAGR
jgi:membrane-associated protease RseP (regulator of RpoE activity)